MIARATSSLCRRSTSSLFLRLLVRNSLIVNAGNVHLSCRSLLLQIVEIVVSLVILLLSVGQVLATQLKGISEAVLNHDVRTKPEPDFAASVRHFGFGPDIVTHKVISVDLLVITVMFLLQEDYHLERALNLRNLALQAGLLADHRAFHELILLVKLIKLSKQVLLAVLVNPGLNIVDEDGSRNFPVDCTRL